MNILARNAAATADCDDMLKRLGQAAVELADADLREVDSKPQVVLKLELGAAAQQPEESPRKTADGVEDRRRHVGHVMKLPS